MNNRVCMERVIAGYRMQKPVASGDNCPDYVYDIMLQCWHADPSSRPTFASLLTMLDQFIAVSEGGYQESDVICLM